jgi:hypothetical protein
MTDRAVAFVGTHLYVQDIAAPAVSPAPSAKAISTIAPGDPTPITFSAAHGLSNGDVITISGVTGATGFNDLSGPVEVVSATEVMLLVDSSAVTGTPTGGNATGIGYHELCVKDFNQTDEEADRIEVTTSCSTKKQYVQGLAGEGTANFTYNHDPCDPAIRELKSAQADRQMRWFKLQYPVFEGDDAAVADAFQAYVASTTRSGATAGAWEGSANLTLSGEIQTAGC